MCLILGYGAIAILSRGDPSSGMGHVGFAVFRNGNTIALLRRKSIRSSLRPHNDNRPFTHLPLASLTNANTIDATNHSRTRTRARNEKQSLSTLD
jgi:hypothetical protein